MALQLVNALGSRHIIYSFHKWLGVTLSLWMILMALSGTVLLYKPALLKWHYPQLSLTVPVSTQAAARILDTLPVALRQGYAYMPTTSSPWLEVVTPDKTRWYFSSDGAVLTRPYLSDITGFLVEFHHHLLLHDTGKDILGVLGIASLIIAFTGLIRWWPTHRFSYRHLSVRWRNPFSRQGMQTLWQFHRSLGVLLYLPILLVLLTGSAIMYASTVNKALVALFPHTSDRAVLTAPPAIDARSWQQRVETAQDIFADAQIRLVYLTTLRMRLKHADEWHPNGRNYVAFSPDGEITELTDVRHTSLGNRLSHTIYPLHVASVGGITLFTAVLLAGIALFLLPISGCWYWFKSYKLRRAKA